MNAIVRTSLSGLPLDGVLLGHDDVITVSAAVHPLKPQAELLILPAGLSISEILDEVSKRCQVSRLTLGVDVSVSGHVIHREYWHAVRVKPSAHVLVRARAGSGIGNIFKSILMIALAVIAPWAGGLAAGALGFAAGTFGAQLVTAAVAGAIMIGGGILLNALFPPAQTKSLTDTPSYSISAGKNGVSKWGPIPVILGKVRAMPKYAAAPYTEFIGDDQYLRMLFVWGYGPMNIEDIKIGDTSIDEFDDVEIETFEGYGDDGQQTLYPSEVVQDDISVDPEYNVPTVRTSASDADEIVLDFVAPSGIGHFNDKGNLDGKTVTFKIELSPTGAGTWVNKGTLSFSDATSKALRRSVRYPVTKGQYDVRVTRQSKNSDDSNTLDDVTWTAIKSFRTGNPPIEFDKPLAITAMRIRATKQLNGVVDTLNGLVTSVGKSWNGSAWIDAQQTRNPGDLMRLVLQGSANARAVADSRVDLTTLAAFADHCTAKGFTFDMYRDFTASVRDTLRDVAAAGRAVPTFKDGKWSVTWEQEDAPIVQHFTPRNSHDFRWNQTYRVLPHGLRCKFVNAAKDYIEDELLAFDEGYTKDNATLYEQAEFPGVTSAENVYKMGLYRLADARERPAVYTVAVDFEHLVAQRGDRVVVQYDVIQQGQCSGRVKAISGQQITLDEPAVMEAGKFYGVRFRLNDGSSVVRQVTTNPGTQTVITITGTVPEVGNLYSFGIRDQETGTYRILRIKPGSDFTADVDLVDDGENVQSGDSTTDIPTGTVTPPPATSTLTPFGLRSESFVQGTQTGNVYVVRIYWQAVLGPEYLSWEVVGTSDGKSIRQVVAGSEQVAEFTKIQSGTWSFTVRGLMTDGKYTLASLALTVPVDVPYDDLGISLGDHQADVNSRLTELQAQLDATSDRLEAIAAATADATGSNIDLHTVSKRFQNATAVALREMTASITDNADGLVAQAAILDAVQASVGEVSANGLRKIEVSAGTGDVVARLTDMVRASIADDWVEAGTVTEVGFTGGDPEQPFSRIVQYANQFVFTDGTSTAIPVVFDGGVAYLDQVRVRSLIAAELEVIGKFNAGTVLEDGTIITSLISANTLVANDSGSFDSFNAGGETNLTKVSINCPNPNPSFVFIEYSLSAQAYRSSGGAVTTTVNLVRIGASGTTILDSAIAVNSSTSGAVTKTTGKQFMVDEGGEVDSTYEIQVSCTASNKTFPQTTSGYAKLIWWQR